MEKLRLKNQTCLISGASSGIGKAIAIQMGKEGANVIINYYSNKEGAEDTANTISQNNTEAKAIIQKADVSQEEQVETMFKKSIEEFGTIDILVANAGIEDNAPFHEMTLKQWNRVLDINLTGQFLCARAAIREFLKRGMRKDVSKALGKIIHMSSVHQIIPWAGHANYAASKGGMVMLMETLAQSYGKEKIRVNSIAPGAIKTPINKEAWDSEEALQKLLKLVPYNRIGETEDIGKVAAWLASDESDYITGTTIYVDGGMTCYPGFTANG